MPGSKSNRNSNKGSEEDSRKGKPKDQYQKMPDDKNNPAESISTADDTANWKYSRTRNHKEEIDNGETR
jgi:hypothetical protein